MTDHDPKFLSLVSAILEGKEPPKKDKKSDDGEKKASEVLDKVRKDIGSGDSKGDDKSDDDKGDDGKGVTPDKDTDDNSGSPDVPEEGAADGGPEADPEGSDDKSVKKPRKLDVSKDPFKGEKPGEKKDDKSDDDQGDDSKEESTPDPEAKPKSDSPVKDDGKDDGAEEKSSKDDNAGPEESGDDEEGEDSATGAKKGKKVGKEDPDGDEESDNPSGESPGEVVDGSSESEINLTPKIEDEELSERLSYLMIKNGLRHPNWGWGTIIERREGEIEVLFDHGIEVIDEKHIGFKKLEGKLAHEKGVTNPAGLAAAIGRKKYGKKKFQAMSEDFETRGHHSRMYRYHDQMARVLDKAIKKGDSKELRKQRDYHAARCSHHETAMDPKKS